MKIVVDEIPKEPCECLFATIGHYANEEGYDVDECRCCTLDDNIDCDLNPFYYGKRQCDKLIAFQDLIGKKE